jgi:hypothetical protein
MRKHLLLLALLFSVGFVQAQEQVNGRWVDDNLTIWIEQDLIRKQGVLYYCIADTSRGTCIQNLTTGFELKLYDANGEIIYEGFASGRRRGVQLPKSFPKAYEVEIVAFKPWVVNKSSAGRIYQKEAIRVKYRVK